MKKFLPLVLALLMLLSLVACGEKTPAASNEKNEDTQQSEQTTTNPGSEAQTSQPDESTQDTSSGYHFKGYTETADWPAADMWESFGLPELILTDDVSGAVHISDKEWIYPLNGSDGILIEAWPASSQIDAIVDTLKDAGVDMQEDQDFEKGYAGSYDNNGTKMKITVSETGSGKLTVLIVTNPTED